MEEEEDSLPGSAAPAPLPAATRKEAFQQRRGSSKSRLSKQDEVEEVEAGQEDEDNSPSSEASDATIVPTVGVETPVVQTPGGGSPEDSNSPDDHNAAAAAATVKIEEEADRNTPTQQGGPNPKVKLLVRSHALCDDGSPPPDDKSPSHVDFTQTIIAVDPSAIKTATLQVSPTPTHRLRPKLSKDSSQGSTVSENGTSPGLSRDSSVDYTDSTGTDLEAFIKNTLNSKQHKDRQMLLKLEREMVDFIKDNKSQILKFPQMTSYHRMLVHRVAAFFGLDHNVDQSGKCVVVNRTPNTRLPDFKFRDQIMDDGGKFDDESQPKRLILKRDEQSRSFDDGRSPDRLDGLEGKKSKSFDERVDEYERARARIFSQEQSQSQEGLLESPMSRPGTRTSSNRSSKEDLRWASEPRPWSSTDSSGYSTDSTSSKLKVAMTKASSFHGVTVLSRADSRTGSNYSGSSRLSLADSISSGMSSLSSPMTRPPTIPSSPPPDSQEATSTSPSHLLMLPHQHSHDGTTQVTVPVPQPQQQQPQQPQQPQQQQLPCLPMSDDQGEPMAIWVATSWSKIPPGSIIINPQTGQPHTNPDGSMYRWQPPPLAPPPKQQSPQMLTVPQPFSQQPHMEQRSFSLDSSTESGISQTFSQISVTRTPSEGSNSGDAPQMFMVTSPPHSSQPQFPTQVQYLPPSQPGGPVRYIYSQPAAAQQPTQPPQAPAVPPQSISEPPQPPPQPQYSAGGQFIAAAAGQTYYPIMQAGSQAASMQPPPQVAIQTVDGYGQQFSSGPPQQPQVASSVAAAAVSQTADMQQQQQQAGQVMYQAVQSVAGSGQQPVFYSTSVASPAAVVSGQQQPQQQVYLSSSQYQPRPPSGQAAGMMVVSSSTPQYVSYTTYPVGSGQRVPTPQQAAVSFPQQQQFLPQQPSQPGPRQPTPQQAQQQQLGPRSTPPPSALQYSNKVYQPADPRTTPTDMKDHKVGQQQAGGQVVVGLHAAAVAAAQVAASQPRGPVPPPGAVFRPAAPIMAETRLVGPPLQQMAPRPLQPIIAVPQPPRPRVPGPAGTSTPRSSKGQGRRGWLGSRGGGSRGSGGDSSSGASPLHSSTESMESNGTCSRVSSELQPACTLEVCNLGAGMSCCDAAALTADLPARLYTLTPAQDAYVPLLAGDDSDASAVCGSTVLAVFDSEAKAQAALSKHHNPHYSLRPVLGRVGAGAGDGAADSQQ